MNKTPKAYRYDLTKDFLAKRKDANEKIKRINENPDFLNTHKEEAIKVVKDNLYKELDDARGTEEYKITKSKKQALRGKKKEVKKHEEIVAEQKTLLLEKEDELGKMTEEYGEKTEKKESKETLTKSLEFEKDTFKIDSTGWKEATDENDPVSGKFVKKGIRVKVNPTGDVVEYLEDKEDFKKGEQIFIDYNKFLDYVAADKHCSREEVEKKYLMTMDEFKEKMKDKPNGSEEYKKFFNEEVKGHCAGCWHPTHKVFYGLGLRSGVWLVGGDDAGFGKGTSGCYGNGRHFGFSGRLLKN